MAVEFNMNNPRKMVLPDCRIDHGMARGQQACAGLQGEQANPNKPFHACPQSVTHMDAHQSKCVISYLIAALAVARVQAHRFVQVAFTGRRVQASFRPHAQITELITILININIYNKNDTKTKTKIAFKLSNQYFLILWWNAQSNYYCWSIYTHRYIYVVMILWEIKVI